MAVPVMALAGIVEPGIVLGVLGMGDWGMSVMSQGLGTERKRHERDRQQQKCHPSKTTKFAPSRCDHRANMQPVHSNRKIMLTPSSRSANGHRLRLLPPPSGGLPCALIFPDRVAGPAGY